MMTNKATSRAMTYVDQLVLPLISNPVVTL